MFRERLRSSTFALYRRRMENRVVTSETRRTMSSVETYSSVSSSYSTNSESLAVTGEDVTMKQLATARETFSDLETAYRKFKLELENVKEEHRNEVRLWFICSFNLFVVPAIDVIADCFHLHRRASGTYTTYWLPRS